MVFNYELNLFRSHLSQEEKQKSSSLQNLNSHRKSKSVRIKIKSNSDLINPSFLVGLTIARRVAKYLRKYVRHGVCGEAN